MKARFFEQSVVDVLIENVSRNHHKWGVLRTSKDSFPVSSYKDTHVFEIAPVFGNSGSFDMRASADDIRESLDNRENFEESAANAGSPYGRNGKKFSAREFFEWAEPYPEFQQAVARLIPFIREKMPEIRQMFCDLPETHTLKNGETVEVCSHERAELYLLGMRERLDELLVPEYEKILQKREEEGLAGMTQAGLIFD